MQHYESEGVRVTTDMLIVKESRGIVVRDKQVLEGDVIPGWYEAQYGTGTIAASRCPIEAAADALWWAIPREEKA